MPGRHALVRHTKVRRSAPPIPEGSETAAPSPAPWQGPSPRTTVLLSKVAAPRPLQDALPASAPTAPEFAAWLCAVATSSFPRNSRATPRFPDARSPQLRVTRRLSYNPGGAL